MGPADAGGGAEQIGVALKLPVAPPEDVPGKHHSRVGRPPHLADVLVGVRRAPDDHQLHPARPQTVDPRERLDEQMRVVLGLQPADEQDVAPRLQPELVQGPPAVVARVGDAVGDHADPPPVALLVGGRDRVAVGDGPIGEARRRALGEAQVGLGRGRLLAVGVQAVDVDERRDARRPRARRRPRAERSWRSASLPPTALSAPASAAGSSGSAYRTASPHTSAIPGDGAAITGVPSAIASSAVSPNPSWTAGCTSAAAPACSSLSRCELGLGSTTTPAGVPRAAPASTRLSGRGATAA